MRQAHLSWGHKYLPGAVPVGLVGSAYGAHLHQQATEDISGQRFCSSADFFPPTDQGVDQLSVTSIDAEKQHLRERARQTRSEIATAASSGTQAGFEGKLAGLLHELSNWQVISGYLALGDEINPLAVMEQFRKIGKTCVLPVVVGRGRPLIFREWEPGNALEDGPLKTRHPVAAAAELDPDILLVPLLAFDRDGYRLGWGGGFYDRTLGGYSDRGRSITAIGIAYSGQQLDQVPHDAYDQRVDFVVTETGVVRTDQRTKALK